MIKTFKVMLQPNNKQETKLYLNANAARYAFNWALDEEDKNHKEGKPFIGEYELRRRFTEFKKTEEFRSEFLDASNDAMKQGIRDAVRAFQNFFSGRAGYPNFKSAHKSRPSFYQDPCKIKFTDTHVRIQKLSNNGRKSRESLNWVKLAEKGRILEDAKYLNPRITFDGLHWWVSVGIEIPGEALSKVEKTEGLGIDLGIKDLAILSDGRVYANINKNTHVRRLFKRAKRLQRAIARKFKTNNMELSKGRNKFKKGKSYRKTRSIIKSQKQFLRLSRRITNILREYIRSVVSEIVKGNPSFVVLEDLNVKGMMKNRRLSKAVQAVRFGQFRTLMTEKCREYKIPLVIADRWYPSSKMCSKCGYIKKDLTLNDRIYHCPNCGNTVDRDFQAALNLKTYGMKRLHLECA